uniref:Uncharacterized protein n=1 Tax=Brassica campestris TaxID=3711 RepID=M4FGD8_BRACM
MHVATRDRRNHHTPAHRQARHHHQPQLRIAGNRRLLSFVFTIIVFLSSRRSRRHRPRRNRSSDEAVRASKSYADCARFFHAPPPDIASAVFRHRPPPHLRRCQKSPPPQLRRRRESPPPLPPANFPVRRRLPPPSRPVTDTGDSPVTRSTRPSQLSESSRLTRVETDTETDFCMPDCMRLWPTIVDRLSCSLEVSINRPRAVSEHYLELCCLACETNKYVILLCRIFYWTFLSDFIWAWVSVIGFMGFYIMGYCWWPVVLSEKETDVTLLYDDASVVTRCPPDRRVLARCSAVGRCLSSSVFSRVISFFGHDFEVIQEWICDVSATSPLQAIVPRVLLLEIM